MKKLLPTVAILLLVSCKTDIKEDINYLYDNGNYEVFPSDVPINHINISAVDSLKFKLENTNPKEFSLDVYPFQFGPEEDLNNNPLEDVYLIGNNWPLGFLTNYKSIKKLSIASVCSFTFHINPDNEIRHLKLSSHSCGRAIADEQIHFQDLKKLKSIHFRSFVLNTEDLKGLIEINSLKSITATDCEFDMADLIGLKDQLRYLNLTDSSIKNIELLKEFRKLEVLYIGGTGIEKVDFLTGLNNIVELSIKNNPIKDLSPLGEIKNLETIYAQNIGTNTIPASLKGKKIVNE